jgi:2-pyrone-4,6-dicarboxylate lactonase
MTKPELTWKPDPRMTKVKLPSGATDAHCHVFGPVDKFPYEPTAKFKPAEAVAEDLFRLHDQMGIERCVIVQSGCHGFDNRVVADAMAKRPGRYLGVALSAPEVSDAELDRLNGQGFRGIRYNYMSHLAPGATEAQLIALAPRLAERGWHLQVHMEDRLIADMAPVLSGLPVTVVLDHMGRVDASKGVDQPEFQAYLRLLDHDHIWSKVSGSERISRQDPPYADAIPFARTIVERFPDRTVWGTDWPHPNFRADPPDDGDLFDLLADIAPTDTLLNTLMVDNPAQLYGFKENI